MKLIGLILLGTLGGVALALEAQVAAPPSVDLYSGEKQPEVTATPSPEPNGPNVPELSQLDETFKETSLGKEGDERRLHIEWRHLGKAQSTPRVLQRLLPTNVGFGFEPRNEVSVTSIGDFTRSLYISTTRAACNGQLIGNANAQARE